MKLLPFWNNKFKFIIFEGPDCCGKTTQINRVAKKYDASLVIHFPRLDTIKNEKLYFDGDIKDINPAEAFKKLDETLYDKDFMTNKIINNKNFISRWFNFNKIIKALKYNIEANKQDKFLALSSLNSLYYTFDDFLNLLESRDYKFYLHGKLLSTETDANELRSYHQFILNNPDKFFIFMDRFSTSGKIYNYLMIKKLWCEKYSKLLPNKFTVKILDTISLEEKTSYELLQYMKNNLFKNNFDNTTNNITNSRDKVLNVMEFVFKYSNIIYDITMKDEKREISNYDTNVDIKTNVRSEYEAHILNNVLSRTPGMPFTTYCVDTDNYIQNNGDNSLDVITNDIYNAINNQFNDINRAFMEIHNIEIPNIRQGYLTNSKAVYD